MDEEIKEWWDLIGQAHWQHVVVFVVAVAALVALCFVPGMTCGVSINDSPTTTTTAVR